MPRVQLLSGAYSARSIIANAQRCLNLYPEAAPQETSPPVPVTHYPTPGTRGLSQCPVPAAGRALYAASNGTLYATVGSNFYQIKPDWSWTLLGTITAGSTPVSMADNGLTLIAVDGTPNGYSVDLTTQAYDHIVADGFYGGDRVAFIDTFLLLNRPGTTQFYSSDSEAITFDTTYIAGKTGAPDLLASLIVADGHIWLLGTKTSEIWFTSGDANFPFARQQGVFIEHGIVAKHSVAKLGAIIFWLSQDAQGQGVVLIGQNYASDRVSTHAIETEFATYARLDDAIGYAYQQGGHVFYVLTFPGANKTWVYDAAIKEWHERGWTDPNGVIRRHRGMAHAFAYGENVVMDWETGALLALDTDVFDDVGNPIVRLRSFPHLGGGGARVSYSTFIADMEVGTTPNIPLSNPPLANLRWSDSRGASWGNYIQKPMGASGEHKTVVQFTRLGEGRDRVFELSWSAPIRTALNGALIQTSPSAS